MLSYFMLYFTSNKFNLLFEQNVMIIIIVIESTIILNIIWNSFCFSGCIFSSIKKEMTDIVMAKIRAMNINSLWSVNIYYIFF